MTDLTTILSMPCETPKQLDAIRPILESLGERKIYLSTTPGRWYFELHDTLKRMDFDMDKITSLYHAFAESHVAKDIYTAAQIIGAFRMEKSL